MAFRRKNGTYVSTTLEKFPFIVHGFTDNSFGDMKHVDSRSRMLKANGVYHKPVISLGQPSLDTVILVNQIPQPDTAQDADGMYYIPGTEKVHPVLTIRTADCMPIVCVDTKKMAVGMAHSGWKGTLMDIAPKLVRKFTESGSKVTDLEIAIGPYIHDCCYDVDKNRYARFVQKYPDSQGVAKQIGDRYFVDIGQGAVASLMQMGLVRSQIDVCDICTRNDDRFFSYRRQAGNTGSNLSFVTVV